MAVYLICQKLLDLLRFLTTAALTNSWHNSTVLALTPEKSTDHIELETHKLLDTWIRPPGLEYPLSVVLDVHTLYLILCPVFGQGPQKGSDKIFIFQDRSFKFSQDVEFLGPLNISSVEKL